MQNSSSSRLLLLLPIKERNPQKNQFFYPQNSYSIRIYSNMDNTSCQRVNQIFLQTFLSQYVHSQKGVFF